MFFAAGLLPAMAGLPPGWSDTDIGAPADTGSASVNSGVWTISGGGADIWGTSDQCNFASESINCDGAVVALVTGLQNSDPASGWSKAGVMFRDDATPGAVNAFMTATAGQGVAFQYRATAGAASVNTQVAGVGTPVWVRVVRASDQFSGYYSLDGSNWTQVGSAATIEMAGAALAGLAVTAHNNAALNTATFANVGLTSPAFGIYRELWTNLNSSVGNTLAALTNTTDNPNWPNNPAASYTHIFTNFETEINTGMNYFGQRLRTFVVPPTNGAYTFWIASDDTSQLYLSTNENPAGMAPIASNTAWTGSEQWTEYASQQSAPISLQGGCRYYLEAQMQQGTGGENLSVRWQLPNGTFEQPMAAVSGAGTLLIPCNGVDTEPAIFTQSSNETVVENLTAVFSVLVTNQSPSAYQWFDGAVKLTGATLPVYTLTNASLTLNNGQNFTCVISNSAGSITSAPIALTVLRDTVPPTVAGVFNVGTTNVEIIFSKPLAVTNTTNAANYVFTNGTAITGAALAVNNYTVTLTTAPLVYGSNYTIVINNIQDLASTPNVIAANTPASFTARPFVLQDVGSPALASTVTYVSNGVNASSAGNYIGGNSDQFGFEYQLETGNFDVAVCLAGLGLSDLWAQAGLMARTSLNAGSPFAAALATPGMVGDFFADRTVTNGLAATAGSFPANYPDTWLRLNRVGNVFTGFGSCDGTNWTALGSATITMPGQIYLGLVVTSHAANQTTAQFVDYETTPAGAVVASPVNPHEPLGPSSRKTGIVISEIMWKPAPRTDGNNTEFLEIYNSCPFFQDISGYQVTCADMNYTFPSNTVIPGGAFFVLCASPQSIADVYGLTSNVFGPYNGSLKHSETLELLDEQSNILLTVPYTDTYPWPVAADGTGHSIVLAHPTYGEGDPRAWDISDTVGGSPGGLDTFHPSPLRNVVINELLPHSENPAVPQFIELYNHSTNSVDVSGCILTDDPATNKFVIPAGTVIAAAGFASFTQPQFGFTLNGQGETLYFVKPDGSRILDAVQFGAQADGVSYGRWPDGANDFYAFATNTPGAHNSAILIGDVVINELMYDPISGNDDDQYIELYNKGTNTISLSGWQFTSGVTFTFPPGAVIGPGGYVVVGKNIASLFANYTNLNPSNTCGNYSGKLSHNGEKVALSQPVSYFGTNTIYVEEDEVTYGTGGRWGEWSSGGGSSLELIDPHSNHRLAANWADSDETKKSSWVDIENTGVLDNGSNYEAGIFHAQIGLLDAGECLVDNIEVDYNGSNYVSNGTFENGLGLTNWTLQGCMVRSSLENTGYQSSYSLHIRSSDRIWTGVNSCQVALANTNLQAGQTATLRFKARWLRGWPEALLRLNGNWLEATAAMPVPANLGSPGGPNSQYVTNAGPAIYNVTHTPTVPAANQAVVVTANVHDPDGVQNLTLYYRLDPAANYTAVAMKDDGTGGDAVPGDGVFSATIPGQAANQIAAFYISASDSLGAATRFPALRPNDNEPVRECVVMFGDGNPGGSFGVYHLWLTQTNITRWANLSDLSNEGNDCTFVAGNRVIYNMQGRFAGSPYHQEFDTPNGSLCHYKWEYNDDDKFLGATDFNKIHQPGNGPGDDASLQREELANTFLRALGVPWLYKRLVAVYVNGNRRGTLMEDTQVPDTDVVKEHFPNDDGGFLYKMQPWFEMAPLPSGNTMSFSNMSWCNLMPYITTGRVKKPARYRYSFEIRRTPDSDNDFTNVFSLVDAASSYGAPNYAANMENLANMENWMRVFAANHAAGNWDSYGAQNGQNLYGYIGALGTKYTLLMWDFNIVIGNSSSWGPGQNLFTVNSQDPNTQNIYNNPAFLRMYWRALQELVNGPLNVANSGPLLMAKYNEFTDNGLSVENPTANIEPWLSQAQTSIASQLAAVNATNFAVNPTVTVSNNVAYVTGQAPVNVDAVWINGFACPLTWTTLTNWIITVPLTNGANNLSIVGVDRNGQPVAGASNQLAVAYSGIIPSPVGKVVINEIMYNPAIPGAQYVELFNTSTNVTFDLSGWQFQGLSYTFPAGASIAPNGFLVLAANGAAFAGAYGATNLVFDTFGEGELATNGTTLLALEQPGGAVVTEVQFDSALPWPAAANGQGFSLQLIDPRQDNWRAGNWTVGQTNPPPVVPQWVEAATTGTASTSLLYIYLQSAGDVYVDDIKLVAGSVADIGANTLTDGDFESGFPDGSVWNVSPNLAGSALSTTIKHSGNASLHVVSTAAGTTESSAIYQFISPVLTTNAAYTLSYWYLQSTNGGPLTVRLSGSGIVDTVNPAPPAAVASLAFTPDASNSVAASLPPFPPLWINEVEPDNLTGLTNRAGQHAPWVELFNPSTNTVALTNLYLADTCTNLTNWAFPSAAVIAPGQFLVIFADGQTNLSTSSELHASFTLPPSSGSVALSRLYLGQPQVLDYVNYSNLPPNWSYGSLPDGQSFVRVPFYSPTPGASNNNSGLPPASFIAYSTDGSVYTQNFDSLPDPGPTSVNTANPVTINGVTYSLANPFDFAFPVSAAGSTGGLGLAATMAGWYGLADPTASVGVRFGATDGDQTTGGQISFGLPNSSNRALGLLATSTTGYTAIGAKFINNTGTTLNFINLQVTGEIWRQSDKPKTLECYYFIDPTAIAPMSTQATAYLPAFNVSFPTNSGDVGGAAVDGTAPANQTNLVVTNQPIAAWPPDAALWLVWEMADSTGKSQGLAIDNLSFAATTLGTPTNTVTLGVQASSANAIVLSWPAPATGYQLYCATNLTPPVSWSLVTNAPAANNGTYFLSILPTNAAAQFFRLMAR
jgi:regulation of enolase protein 1 (concanavalin A-like superfamily)